ncbi:hypothetical protein F5Y13DRAFT_202765 [Hypoxylon sp. FL1857]|nr:hypothetical protein F5Y13DRAFT_202765 [Hypoxylon sp. FL1857]
MAEAVAAFAVAVNILQVIDFGAKFINAAWKIWRSGKDSGIFPFLVNPQAVDGLCSLLAVSEDLEGIVQQLQADISPSSHSKDETNDGISAIAGECRKAAQHIIDSIRKIGIPSEPEKIRRHGKPFLAAFKVAWQSEKITGLQAQLDGYRSQLILNLAVSIRSCVTKSLRNQDLILGQLVQSRSDNNELASNIAQISDRQYGLGSALIEYFAYNRGNPSESDNLRKSLIDAIYDSSRPHIANVLAFEIPEARRSALERRFLSKIRYRDMNEREEMVVEAHVATFRWIFDAGDQSRPWANFCHWLESDQQLYWITGKAGSGKSTLMKFISQPIPTINSDDKKPRCTEYLLRWAKDKPLLVASFYFWGSGRSMQTSKEGLYRTLLCQVLQACPEATPHASPEAWEALCLYDEDPRPFNEAQLRSILARAIAFVGSTRCLCLFIDGLDEFDGKHDDLIKLITGIMDTPSIKVCVASRPLSAFERALKGKPSLMLEDLTFDDIREYVTSRFRSDREFSKLEEDDGSFAEDLIREVVQKASGVFLWVDLVVTSLLEGITFGDRVSDLRKRLDQLPSELGELYDRILDNLDLFYHEHAAQYFYLMRACEGPLDALLLSFADEDDPNFAINLTKRPLSYKQIHSRIDIMRRRLSSRCKGLVAISKSALEEEDISSLERTTVQYLHKTVKDYMEQPSIREKLSGMVQTPFDPYFKLCSGALAIFKIHGHETGQVVDLQGHQKLRQCMQYASNVSRANLSSVTRILDELERSISCDQVPLFTDIDIWAQLSEESDMHFGNSFLSLAVKYGVVEYVKRKTEPGCLVQTNKEPFGPWNLPRESQQSKNLWNLFGFQGSRRGKERSSTEDRSSFTRWPLLLDATPSRFTNPAIVSALLRNGADPNFVISRGDKKSSIWTETLAFVMATYSGTPSLPDRWMEVLRAMVIHGASIDTKTINDAMHLAVSEYLVRLDSLEFTVSGLQRHFRSMKYEPKQYSSSLADAQGRRMTRGTYNPYNNMHVKLKARSVRMGSLI